ncbi:unnamed protein product [Durusdinium trenchii]|uniref:Uncharacterized protein n=2 Tax=Durusdinium trenchii TaxID=1381693 RepID=A0ABP0L1B2_9DINO
MGPQGPDLAELVSTSVKRYEPGLTAYGTESLASVITGARLKELLPVDYEGDGCGGNVRSARVRVRITDVGPLGFGLDFRNPDELSDGIHNSIVEDGDYYPGGFDW